MAALRRQEAQEQHRGRKRRDLQADGRQHRRGGRRRDMGSRQLDQQVVARIEQRHRRQEHRRDHGRPPSVSRAGRIAQAALILP